MTNITNDFTDIINLINMAYDYFYNKNKTLCYSVSPMDINNVKSIKNIKCTLDNVNSPKFINSIFNDRINFLHKKMTSYGHKYTLKRLSDPSVDIVISLYNDNVNNLYDPINLNKAFHKLFSDFITHNQTENIRIQIVNVDIQLSELNDFLSIIPQLKELMIDENADKMASITLYEHFFKMRTMDEYLTKEVLDAYGVEHYKGLIFQVAHVLAIITNKYVGFRHNKLALKYMEGYIHKSGGKMAFSFGGKDYTMSNPGFIYKMSNFDDSTIIDVFENDNIVDNDKTDFVYFLDSLKKHVNSVGAEMDKDTLSFIDRCMVGMSYSEIFLDIYFS